MADDYGVGDIDPFTGEAWQLRNLRRQQVGLPPLPPGEDGPLGGNPPPLPDLPPEGDQLRAQARLMGPDAGPRGEAKGMPGSVEEGPYAPGVTAYAKQFGLPPAEGEALSWWRRQSGLEPMRSEPLPTGLGGGTNFDEPAERGYGLGGEGGFPPGVRPEQVRPPTGGEVPEEPPGQITSPVAGGQGLESDARPNPNVMVPPSGWRSLPEHLNQTLAQLIHSPLSPQQKLEGVQSLLAQHQQMQGAQQGQNEAARAWQSVAPRPIGPAETAHYTRAAEAQIAQVPRPQQFTRQSLQQYQIATRKRQEQVQAQVNHWSQIEMKTRMATSQQAFQGLMAGRREEAAMSREDRRDERRAQMDAAIKERQEQRADQREKEKRQHELALEERDARRAQQKAEAEEQKKQGERSQQQRLSSYRSHLRDVMREEQVKRKAWDKDHPGEPVSPAPHEALAGEARRRVLLEERQFAERQPGGQAGGAPQPAGASAADQAKAFEEAARRAMLGGGTRKTGSPQEGDVPYRGDPALNPARDRPSGIDF